MSFTPGDGHLGTREILLDDQTQVGEARRAAQSISHAAGFSETDAARAGIVATELASNIVKHGISGVVLLNRGTTAAGVPFVEVVAVDRGRGIGNIRRALEDGFSTAGSPGTGLGAVQRQSELFETLSSPSWGTAILARIVAGRSAPASSPLSVLSVPRRGESHNGDSWSVRRLDDGLLLAVVDGLGHGALAHDAAAMATKTFQEATDTRPGVLLQRMHDALRSTRGAAAAVMHIDRPRAELVFAGLGNVALSLIGGAGRRSAVSMYGTVGHQMREIREFRYDCPTGVLVIAHTDGISAKWDLDAHAGLAGREPALIAGVLWRDYRRQNDDATLLVYRT